MGKNIFLLPALIISVVVLALHLLALEYFLYWTHGWFDLLIHALAGAMIGFISVWVLSRSKSIFFVKPFKFFLIIFITTSLISIYWEIFEFIFGLTFTSLNYVQDTILDIVMTVLGGMTVFLYLVFISKFFLKEKPNAE